jgi:hypothetical protein
MSLQAAAISSRTARSSLTARSRKEYDTPTMAAERQRLRFFVAPRLEEQQKEPLLLYSINDEIRALFFFRALTDCPKTDGALEFDHFSAHQGADFARREPAQLDIANSHAD